MKAVILILCGNTPIYREFKRIWESYQYNHPQISVYFVQAIGEHREFKVHSNNIFVPTRDTYIPGFIDKTHKSIEWLINNAEWDFLMIAGIASLVCMDRLYEYLKSLPTEKTFAAWAIFDSTFLSGTSVIRTRDVIEDYIICYDSLRAKQTYDDGILTQFYFENKEKYKLYEYNVRLLIDRYYDPCYVVPVSFFEQNKEFQIRVKTTEDEILRKRDVEVLQQLKDVYYG